MLEFLPESIRNAINNLNYNLLFELRLRKENPVQVNYDGIYSYLSSYGIVENSEFAITVTEEDILNIIYNVGDFSIYSVDEEIKQGYITTKNGVRIGIAGEVIQENGKIISIKNYSSLCIRIPHRFDNCSKKIFDIYKNEKLNILIVSSPGYGKTTLLRDIARQLSMNTKLNILICDERGELSFENLGDKVDVIKFCDKAKALEIGLRALRPDVVLCDEILNNELYAVNKVVCSGVNMIASAHFKDFSCICKEYLEFFDIFVVLDNQKIGQIKSICRKDGTIY